jgi:hypothetical protein
MKNILIAERENETADFLESNIKTILKSKSIDALIQKVHSPEEAIEELHADHSSPMISAGKVTRTREYDLVISSSFYEVNKADGDLLRGIDLWKGAPIRYSKKFMFHTGVPNEHMQNLIQKTHNAYVPTIEKYNVEQLQAAIKQHFRI